MERSDFHRQLVDGTLTQLTGWEGRNHWSFNVMLDLVRDAPDIAWPLLVEIADRADDDQLGRFGAGILEDFIAANGRQFIDRIEERAASDPRFRLSLQNVWRQGGPSDIWKRIVPLLDGRTDQAEAIQSDYSGWLKLSIAGLPPGSPGSVSDEIVRRRHLLETIRDWDDRPNRDVFQGPVAIEITVEPGPDMTANFDAARVLASVIETVSLDRPAESDLADLAGIAVIASPGLVWEARFDRIRRRVEAYRLDISSMRDGQVEAKDDPR